jgi:hypothetical protein
MYNRIIRSSQRVRHLKCGLVMWWLGERSCKFDACTRLKHTDFKLVRTYGCGMLTQESKFFVTAQILTSTVSGTIASAANASTTRRSKDYLTLSRYIGFVTLVQTLTNVEQIPQDIHVKSHMSADDVLTLRCTIPVPHYQVHTNSIPQGVTTTQVPTPSPSSPSPCAHRPSEQSSAKLSQSNTHEFHAYERTTANYLQASPSGTPLSPPSHPSSPLTHPTTSPKSSPISYATRPPSHLLPSFFQNPLTPPAQIRLHVCLQPPAPRPFRYSNPTRTHRLHPRNALRWLLRLHRRPRLARHRIHQHRARGAHRHDVLQRPSRAAGVPSVGAYRWRGRREFTR